MRAGLETEDPDDPSLARVAREVGRKIGGGPDVGRIVGSYVAGKQKPVAADAGVDGDVLLAVGSPKRDRRAHDTGSHFELPQLFARARVGGLEPAIERTVEYEDGEAGLLPPSRLGQMPFTLPRETPVVLLVSSTGRPVDRLMCFAHVTFANGSATSSSPVLRSIVYAKPFLSKCTRTLRSRPPTTRSTRIISAFES